MSAVVEVSPHLCRIFAVMRDDAGWLTSKEVAVRAEVAERTSRHHLKRLVNYGLLDQSAVWTGHRYRLREEAEQHNPALWSQIHKAERTFNRARH